ncbi:TonB-dependent receptor [bacterium]|nr:TonB-dependent receptor [bacterium]MBU1883535.1 TonB-dependent receptor [bacterium]
MKKHLIMVSFAACAALADTFTLGQINVQDNNNSTKEINLFEQSIDSKTIAQNNSETVSEALDNISGVNQDVQGGRGESTLYIRGFNANRIGVFIDGIPVYVPYDGNFDYARFLTSDIGEIDVSKGYSSVVYGANTMGGVVNIVSKKPTKALEGEIKAGIVVDSIGKMARHEESLNIGTRQGHYYAQLGAVVREQDHYRLSNDYTATASQPLGDSLRSQADDRKISLKAGYIADDQSEVAISYANQKGKKQQPPATDTEYSKTKYWDWPVWDKETVSVVGQKNFDESYIKALAYYDKFTNSLFAYDDATYTTMNKGSSFKSRYEDYSAGARLEYGIQLGDNFIKAAANFKKDVHKGYDLDKVTESKTLTENYEDHTLSLGLEDTFEITSKLELFGGISYDQRTADKIYDTTAAYQDMLSKQTESSVSPQVALIYSLDTSSKVKASVSRKTYMPSMKDRYSRKLGTAVPNPDLKNEISTHYELSYQKNYDALTGRVNGFFTRVEDAIQSVVWDQNTSLTQNQNVGTFNHVGGEFELNYKVDGLEAGGNYTYIWVKNTEDTSVKQTDVPKHQLFAFAQKEIGAGFSAYANMKFRSGAYEQKLDKSYVINPDFTTFDIKAIYTIKAITAEIGVKNLTDELVRYDMAFPMTGREYFANLAYKF